MLPIATVRDLSEISKNRKADHSRSGEKGKYNYTTSSQKEYLYSRKRFLGRSLFVFSLGKLVGKGDDKFSVPMKLVLGEGEDTSEVVLLRGNFFF